MGKSHIQLSFMLICPEFPHDNEVGLRNSVVSQPEETWDDLRNARQHLAFISHSLVHPHIHSFKMILLKTLKK